MQIDNWIPFFKFDEHGYGPAMSQQTYEPIISPDGKTFCANYDSKNKYQRHEQVVRPGYTKEVVDYFFVKEIEYAQRFSGQSWAPEILEIDQTRQRIYYKWNSPSCNEMIYRDSTYPVEWKKQINKIITEIFQLGVYKLTMYPHCHYIDNEGQMHTIDMYGCVEIDNPFIEKRIMDGIIHETARFRLDETGPTHNNRYDLEKMFFNSLRTHVKWGEYNLNFVYQNIIGNSDEIYR